MRGLRAVGVSVVAVMLGCAVVRTTPQASEEAPRRIGYRLDVRFTSAVPDLYEVLSGPAETYRRLRVNDRLRRLLDAYGREKQDDSSPRHAEIWVHLNRVTTHYQQIGIRGPPRSPRGGVVPATFDDAEVRDDDRPEEITKTAVVVLTVEVREGGKTLLRDSVKAVASEVTERQDIDPWTYDYAAIVDAALREAVDQLDSVVNRILGPR